MTGSGGNSGNGYCDCRRTAPSPVGDWNSSRELRQAFARAATSIACEAREKVGVGAANVKNRLLIHQQYRPPPPRPSPAAGFALRGRGHIGAGFGVCSRMTDSKSVGAVSAA